MVSSCRLGCCRALSETARSDHAFPVRNAGLQNLLRVLHRLRGVLRKAVQVASDSAHREEVHVPTLPHKTLASEAIDEVVPYLVTREIIVEIRLHDVDQFPLLPDDQIFGLQLPLRRGGKHAEGAP